MEKLVHSIDEQNKNAAEFHIHKAMELLGNDMNREGLLDTPRRFVKFFSEFVNTPDINFTTFKNDGSSRMILVKDIPFYSMCEHHLAPFFGVAHVAYMPDEKIVGLSKIPRLVDFYANQPQNQERITNQICERLNKELECKGVAVMLEARHLCVEMRGVKKPGAMTVTSAYTGAFEDSEKLLTEFHQKIKL